MLNFFKTRLSLRPIDQQQIDIKDSNNKVVVQDNDQKKDIEQQNIEEDDQIQKSQRKSRIFDEYKNNVSQIPEIQIYEDFDYQEDEHMIPYKKEKKSKIYDVEPYLYRQHINQILNQELQQITSQKTIERIEILSNQQQIINQNLSQNVMANYQLILNGLSNLTSLDTKTSQLYKNVIQARKSLNKVKINVACKSFIIVDKIKRINLIKNKLKCLDNAFGSLSIVNNKEKYNSVQGLLEILENIKKQEKQNNNLKCLKNVDEYLEEKNKFAKKQLLDIFLQLFINFKPQDLLFDYLNANILPDLYQIILNNLNSKILDVFNNYQIEHQIRIIEIDNDEFKLITKQEMHIQNSFKLILETFDNFLKNYQNLIDYLQKTDKWKPLKVKIITFQKSIHISIQELLMQYLMSIEMTLLEIPYTQLIDLLGHIQKFISNSQNHTNLEQFNQIFLGLKKELILCMNN